jgi:pyridoxal phosphate enzyme (YggS family)
MTTVRDNCRRVMDRIHDAAARCHRDPSSIRLIAVTKTVSAERVREAVEFGVRDAGENRLQEALAKQTALKDLPLTWHFIGHLQTNKAKKVVESFDVVQSVDRMELARKLNENTQGRLAVLIEVELGNEETKSGVASEDLPQLLEQVKACDRLDVQGLMAIPPYFENAEDSRPSFARLRELASTFGLRELSMGMSHDFEVAIEEGATMVRVGTALFGERAK